MGPNLYRSTLVTQTQAALEAMLVGHAPDSAWEPALLALVLERWGDALRLGEARPLRIEQRLQGVSTVLLGQVAHERIEEIRDWTLPERESAAADLIDDISFAVTRRDETESLIAAVSRWMGASKGLAIDVPGVDELLGALESFDAALAQVATRDVAEVALGVRSALHGDGSWLARLADGSDGPMRLANNTLLEGAEQLESNPSESATDAYVRLGKLGAYVERAAERDPLYAEELAVTIDSLIECAETVAWRARGWRRRYVALPPPSRVDQVVIAAPLLLAAATKAASGSAGRGYQSLGALPGVDAVADLVIVGDELTVRAYPATLRELRVNGLAGQRVAEDDCWVLALPFQRGMALALVIVDEAGQQFVDTLSVA